MPAGERRGATTHFAALGGIRSRFDQLYGLRRGIMLGMKTVLVVEDTDDLRELFLLVLRDAGYSAIGAENGGAALDLLEKMGNEPCLVLLDMMMPVMDGKMFLQALHQTHQIAALPVVVVSAMVSQDQTIDGARKVIRKPVSPKVLLDLVRELCGHP